MAELQPNDEFLVNRNDVTYKQPTETLMAKLENDDYLLINREDVTYKISGEDIIDSLIDPLELEVTLDITNPAPDETITAIASPSGGKQPYTPITYQWKKRDQGGNITDLAGETNSTFLVTGDLAAFELACEATVSDSLGNSVTTLSAFTSPVTFKEQVDTPELLTPPDGAGMGLGTKPESGFILSAETEGPNATMHGLRFDGSRGTILQKNIDIGNTWTYSAWIKKTTGTDFDLLTQGAANADNRLLFQSTGKFVYLQASGNISSSTTYALNEWHNVVFSVDGSNATIYVNGEESSTGTLTKSFANALTYIGLPANKPTSVGNGYLSDVYFVDGQALEPETFGKSFDGKWGPLDSSVVKSNIEYKSPEFIDQFPDDQYDTSQVWSASPTTNEIVEITKSFDGSTSTNSYTKDGPNWLWTNPITNSVTISNKLRVYGSTGNSSNTVFVNGTQIGGNGVVGTIDQWYDLTSLLTLPINLNSFQVNAGNEGMNVSAIEVDDKILVDAPSFGANGFHLPFDPAVNEANSDKITGAVIANEGPSYPILNTTDNSFTTVSSGVRTDLFAQHLTAAWALTNGTNISTVDSMPDGRTSTAHALTNNSVTTSSDAKYYSQSASFDGSNRFTVGVSDPTLDLNFGTGDYTVEAWFRRTTASDNYIMHFPTDNGGSNPAWFFNMYQSNLLRIGRTDSFGNTRHKITSPIQLNTWVHVAVSRQAGISRVFLNGKKIDEQVDPDSITRDMTKENGVVSIGSDERGMLNWRGQIQDLRVYKGIAKYVDDYNPDALSTRLTFKSDKELSKFVLGDSIRQDNSAASGSVFVVDPQNQTMLVSSSVGTWSANTGNYVIGPDKGGIGVDASGQDNHFLDQNFAVGNTDEVWSQTQVGTWVNASRMFDGNLTTRGYGLKAQVNLPTIVANSSIEAYFATGDMAAAGGATDQWEINGVNISALHPSPGDSTNAQWVNLSSAFTLPVQVQHIRSADNNQGAFYAIRVDGEILVDANIQDTVLDTPMNNYAVLETGSNGNLVGAGDPTIQGEAGTTYYYEADGVAQTQEGPISGLTAATYNFGQQPFTDVGPQGAEQTLFEAAEVKARLEIADAGTLDLIEGNPTMTASVGGAKGTYVSHTDSELVLDNISGTWEVASEKAVSDIEYSIAAINPNQFVMTSSAFEATPSNVDHGSSTWQVTEVNDYFYTSPVIDVTSTTALESLTTGGLEEETVYRARVKHTSANAVDSLWSEQRHQNVFKTEKLPVTVPTADMNGLRFDSARETHLNRTLEFSDFTLSVWFKKTGSEVSPLAYRRAQDQNGNLFIDNTRILLTDDGMATKKMTWNVSISDNVWNHIVVSKEGGNYDAYLNGEHLSTIVNSGTPIFGEAANYLLGGRELNIGGFSGTDAYFSDFYLVDGHALAPTAFGALFPSDPSEPNRRWGPLDSTVVIDNINNYEPTPEAVPNYAEKWSDTTSAIGQQRFFSGGSAVKVFDGDLTVGNDNNMSDATPIDKDNCIKFTPATPIENVTSLRVYGGGSTDAGVDPSLWINDDFDNKVNIFNPVEWKTIPLNGVTTITSISWGAQSPTSGMNIRGIEINGRILIDGPADNSQVWSDQVTDTANLNGPVSDLFDGDLTNSLKTVNPLNSYAFIDGLSIPVTSKVSLYSPDGRVDYDLNDGAVTGTGEAGWVDVAFTGTLNKLSFKNSGSTVALYLYGLKVDDKLLIDGAPVWNTSQVWSDYLVSDTGTFDKSPSRAFDGDITTDTRCGTDVTKQISFVPTGLNLTFTNKFRVRVNIDNVNASYKTFTLVTDTGIQTINSNTLGDASAQKQVWAEFTNHPGTVISFTSLETPGVGNNLYAFEVDGEILVDGGNFGANGFYLPFDPETSVTETVYTDNWTIVGSTYDETLFFSPTTPVPPTGAYAGGFTSAASITLNTPIPIQNTLTFYSSVNSTPSAQTIRLKFSDGSESTFSKPSGPGVETYEVNDKGGLSLVSFGVDNSTSAGIRVGPFVVDGVHIVDGINTIVGVDASGKGNHFQDQNFAVGNTDEVWSASLSGGSMASEFDNNRHNEQTLFNGILEWGQFSGYIAAPNVPGIFEPPQSIPFKTLDVYFRSNNGANRPKITIDGVESELQDSNGASGTDLRISSYTNGTFEKLICYAESTSLWWGVTGIVIDGKILVDKNIQDTVLDTPMKNYAVLESSSSSMLSNGNLQHSLTSAASSFATISRPIDTGNFYYETTMNSARYASLGMSLQNASRSGESFSGNVWWWSNESKSFRNNNCSVNGSMGELFNGDLVGIAFNNGSGSVFVNGQLKFTFDDINDVIGNNTIFAAYDRASNDSLAYTVNFGQQPFAASNVTHDLDAGTVVIDGVTYDTLYQTWEQYATFGAFFYNERTDEIIQAFTLQRRYGLLGAKPEAGIYDLAVQPNFAVAAYVKEDNVYVPIEDPAPRIAAAEAQAAADVAAAQAETRKYQRMLIRAACGWMLGKAYIAGDIIIYNGHVFRALEDNVATADNDPGDLIGTWEYLGLEEDAAPLAIDGYFPLYETEEAASTAGNGSYHAHTIDGVTYYMPDAGVTIYHGDYTGFDY